MQKLIDFFDDGIKVVAILFVVLVFFSGMLVGVLWSDEEAKRFMLKEQKCPYELKTTHEIERKF